MVRGGFARRAVARAGCGAGRKPGRRDASHTYRASQF